MATAKIKAVCNGCGRSMDAYGVSLTPMMMNALRKLIKAVRVKGINEIHLTKDTEGQSYELNHTEINNITRLRFHGLVAKVFEDDGSGNKKRKHGYWLITRRAAAFIKGENTLPQTVWIFNDHIVEKSDAEVSIAEVMGSVPYLDTIEDIEYREATRDQQTGKVSLI